MPLPRSGAPSPGQPTQVGASENWGRLFSTESTWASSAKIEATSKSKTANKNKMGFTFTFLCFDKTRFIKTTAYNSSALIKE
ncbi:MAG: hypothetical protein ACI8P2_003600 [Candidatus Latescibacterota bacterium]|jgi:hypothetical protein|tara:strand:- start:439 stop:684 length:246 start_codon:yes stop_codon:yes gene_type:complete